MNTKKMGVALAVVIIFLAVYFPNIELAIPIASRVRAAPSDAWVSSLLWMKENTPEPLGDSDAYYQLYDRNYEYPASAYGVLAWWDYGYWITRIAHRIPNANPGQKPWPLFRVARFFTTQDEASANDRIERLGSAYIIIDYQTATSKFWAIVLWAGEEQADYFDVYYWLEEKRLMPVRLYHSAYYRSFSTRLYNFDGKAVIPDSVTVISYEEEGGKKLITSERQFDTYEEAKTYLLSRESSNHKIVGASPFISPVPLTALKNYQLIHNSDETIEYSESGSVPEVKIFEYLPIFD